MKFPIPPIALSQHIAIVGKTGRGKTTTAKDIVEHAYDEGERICILDPVKSDWWGLISSADGRRAGLPFYILGGPHGHMPLHPHSGKAVAALVASGALPHCIIDMRGFPPGGLTRFFADFAPSLMDKIKGVVRLAIEEAHLFAPKERAGMEKENMSVYYAKNMATGGRSMGIRMMVMTQRTQALHNALLGSCDTMIVHGMTAPADQEPVQKWLKANVMDKAKREAIETSLSGLATGTAWVCSGEAKMLELVKFPLSRTFDNTKTPDGSDAAKAVKTAPMDPEALRAILGKAAQEATENDPATLRKRIAELERASQVDKAPQIVAPSAAMLQKHTEVLQKQHEKAVREAREDGRREGYSAGIALATERLDAFSDFVTASMTKELARLSRSWPATPKGRETTHGAPRPPQALVDDFMRVVQEDQKRHPIATRAELDAMRFASAIPKPDGGLAISSAAQQVLDAVAWLIRKGVPRPALPAVSAIANKRGGNFTNIVGSLRTAGLLAKADGTGTVALTQLGEAHAQVKDDDRPMEEQWMDGMTGSQRKVFEVLVREWPRAPTRDELSSMAGLSGGNYTNILGSLRTMGAIDYPEKGLVALSKYVKPV